VIIYEVNVALLAELYDEYITWLYPHIKEMLRFEGFLKANVLKAFELDEVGATHRHITIQYWLQDKCALNHYLQNHAPSMRKVGIDTWTDTLSISRRYLELIECSDNLC